jgi:hypothetical protein
MPDTYTVIPADNPPGWFTVLCNGVPVWHAPKESAERYAADLEYRARVVKTKAHEQKPT